MENEERQAFRKIALEQAVKLIVNSLHSDLHVGQTTSYPISLLIEKFIENNTHEKVYNTFLDSRTKAK